MCSIIGYCGPVIDSAAFNAAFQRTLSRGPDASRVVKAGSGVLGFHRLSIMGLTPSGMQPFSLNGSFVVCNGEFTALKPSKPPWPISIPSRATQTVKFSCPCIRNTG